MSNKHTPGPWHSQRHDTGDFEVVADTAAGQAELATVHCEAEYVPSLPAEANARLIAAAPELLAALVGLLEVMDPEHVTGSARLHACAVVAHAKGESHEPEGGE